MKYKIVGGPQGTDEWKKERSKRVTASNFGTAVGVNKFCTKEELRKGSRRPTPEAVKVMAHGTETEPAAREWYERDHSCSVEQIGLVVPSWDDRIGCSPDGLVGEKGMIEIKCPYVMYPPLQNLVESGRRPDVLEHSHIWDTHYAQMQGSMAILEREWCDYIVYATESKSAYVERIYFDQKYWREFLYPGLCAYLRGE